MCISAVACLVAASTCAPVVSRSSSRKQRRRRRALVLLQLGCDLLLSICACGNVILTTDQTLLGHTNHIVFMSKLAHLSRPSLHRHWSTACSLQRGSRTLHLLCLQTRHTKHSAAPCPKDWMGADSPKLQVAGYIFVWLSCRDWCLPADTAKRGALTSARSKLGTELWLRVRPTPKMPAILDFGGGCGLASAGSGAPGRSGASFTARANSSPALAAVCSFLLTGFPKPHLLLFLHQRGHNFRTWCPQKPRTDK